jgi:hypothetical protein
MKHLRLEGLLDSIDDSLRVGDSVGGMFDCKTPALSRSRGGGCRLAKGLHGHRLVILDVEDGI